MISSGWQKAILITCITVFWCGTIAWFAQSPSTAHDRATPSWTQTQSSETNSSLREIPIFMGIISSPDHHAYRQALRETWLTTLPQLRDRGVAVRYKFFVGLTLDANLTLQAKEETEHHGDIITVDKLDHYNFINNKTLAIFDYGTRQTAADLVLKVDDDVFVDLPQAVDLALRQAHEYLYMGKFLNSSSVVREPQSKWYVPFEEHPEPVYSSYACGTLYAMGPKLARWIVEHQRDLPSFKIDDVGVGRWVRKAAEQGVPVQRVHEGLFCHQKCLAGTVVAHNVNVKKIHCMWQKLLQAQNNTCC